MADWHGVARSNYFRVKDITKFKERLNGIPVTVVVNEDKGLVMLHTYDNDHGAWPMHDPDDQPIDWETIMLNHLVTGEIFVMQEIGNEKLRYVTGWAMAINHCGQSITVDLDDIYTQCRDVFGAAPLHAAMY